MSSSSFDSDSDDHEPVRKIKISIRPKDDADRPTAADVSQIKASVDAWRPLGPPTHPSLSRRQSSLSSVSSMSFGAASSAYGSPFSNSNHLPMNNYNGSEHFAASVNLLEPAIAPPPFPPPQPSTGHHLLQPSPSCSSLVNPEYSNNKPALFSNFMSGTSTRTSSPLTLLAASHTLQNSTDAIPVAVAIQESMELIIRKAHRVPLQESDEPNFETQALGNIKIAFPHAFAKSCSQTAGLTNKPMINFKLRIYPVNNIVKYYASGLIKDLADTPNPTQSAQTTDQINKLQETDPFGTSLFEDPLDNDHEKYKIIEFESEKLIDKLKRLYDQSSLNKYYNVDILRYQIKPISSIEQSPLQVCAYWKFEQELIKLRIYFEHSSTKSGLNLERLRDISFSVNLASFIPAELDLQVLSPNSNSSSDKIHNNNTFDTTNMNNVTNSTAAFVDNKQAQPSPNLASHLLNQPLLGNLIHENSNTSSHQNTTSRAPPAIPPLLPPPTTIGRNRANNGISNSRFNRMNQASNSVLPRSLSQSINDFASQAPFVRPTDSVTTLDDLLVTSTNINNSFGQQLLSNKDKIPLSTNLATNDLDHSTPFIMTEPRALWNNSIKQLTWKFDTLLSYRKTNGAGSLFAKLNLRNSSMSNSSSPSATVKLVTNCKTPPVDVKFYIADSTLSKINLNLESSGFRMTMLKKEIRSGRYRSEPYVVSN